MSNSGTSLLNSATHLNRKANFEFLSAEQIESLPDLEWLVPEILPRSCLAVLYGEPGCKKTFVAISLALTIAEGGLWLGRQTTPAPVIYIAAEGVSGLKDRISAYRKKHQAKLVHARFVARSMDILNEIEVELFLKDLLDTQISPGLIVVDTLARVTVGADENNSKEPLIN